MSIEAEKVPTTVTVELGLHSAHPDLWGYEVSSHHGYHWGASGTEKEAILQCIEYLQERFIQA